MATLWAIGVAAGSAVMLRHEFDGGVQPEAPPSVPAELAPFVGDSGAITLFLSVHPGCPCTRASLEQLDRFVTAHPGAARIVALFWTDGTTEIGELGSNSYWKTVEKLPGAVAVADPRGRLAAQVGATVSGSVAAYDGQGNLRFAGGLTASRGHSGSSRGLDSLAKIASAEPPRELCSTPAFGCSLSETTGR